MQIDVKDKKQGSTAIKIFTLFAVILIIGLPIFVYFKLQPDNIFNREDTVPEEQHIEEEIVFEEIKPVIVEGYVEELIEIEGQWAYIIAPAYIDVENLPILVIYNHGSVTFVEEDMDEEFKSDLLEYGEALTSNNYIFAASNAHGVNWGSLSSVSDNYNMYEYIKEYYGIQDKVYEIGYSMGGLPSMNFATTYPDLVKKIALLAPTTRTSEWNQERVDKIMDMDIKIWHGNADVNVGYVYTQGFINKLESLGKDVELVTLEGKTHWDIHTEYIDDILDFFSN